MFPEVVNTLTVLFEETIQGIQSFSLLLFFKSCCYNGQFIMTLTTPKIGKGIKTLPKQYPANDERIILPIETRLLITAIKKTLLLGTYYSCIMCSATTTVIIFEETRWLNSLLKMY